MQTARIQNSAPATEDLAGGPAHSPVAGLVLRVVNAAPDIMLAGTFAVAWFRPVSSGPNSVSHLLLLMLLEFVVIHSAALMGGVALGTKTFAPKVLGILGLGAFYSLFTGGFSLAFGTWWPFLAFWGLTANRLLTYLIGGATGKSQAEAMRASWAAGACFYLAGVFATSSSPCRASD